MDTLRGARKVAEGKGVPEAHQAFQMDTSQGDSSKACPALFPLFFLSNFRSYLFIKLSRSLVFSFKVVIRKSQLQYPWQPRLF